MGIFSICLTVLIAAALFIGFYAMRLETSIDEKGISYRFYPFHRKYRTIGWGEVAQAHVRRYRPIREYGGWGLRFSFKHGDAFNVSGDMGLQLVLKKGKKILIGTQKAGEMEVVLKGVGRA